MREHGKHFDELPLRKIKHYVWKVPYSETVTKVRNGQVGESKRFVSEEIKKELDNLWERQITSTIGLKSHDELRNQLSQ